MRNLGWLLLMILLGGCATKIDLQAHRGGRGLMPENTLPAFQNAMRIGVTTLELDTAITRDGVVIIAHDPLLNPDIARGPDGKWLEKKGPSLHSLNYAELMQYDIGRLNPASAYGKRYSQQTAVDGTRYSKLADLFAATRAAGDRHIRFNIETKISPDEPGETVDPETFANTLLAVVLSENMAGRVTLQSFDWRTLKIFQQKAPGIPTVYLSAQQKFLDNISAGKPEGSRWTAGLNVRDYDGSVARMVKAAGGAIWSPYFGDVDEGKIREAQQLGLQVVVWTVNEARDIERMLDWKVDGIISDYPDRVRVALDARGMKVR
ncbi:MAG: glycerophosphodiester phosphodiesterase [Betaproteobacteria bacterium]